MKIVIIGAGKVGEELCVCLAREGHDIVLIEKSPQRLEQLINMADITGVTGNGAIYDTQLEAGVDKCDVFIAVSPHDETNIIGAITAKKIGAKYTIARVRDPEFSSQLNFVRESLGITMMVNPEKEAADEILRIIEFPSALGIERFDNGRVNIVEVRVGEGSPLDGVKVRDLHDWGTKLVVCVINRNDEIIIPEGDTEIRAGDHIHVTGMFKDLDKLYVSTKSYKQRLDSALIVGGGKITQYLLPRLVRLRMKIKVIEVDSKKADKLAETFPTIDVLCGDGTEQAFLRQEGLKNYDTSIALTQIDEENLLMSIFAKQQGVKKTICKVNRTDLLKVVDDTDLDSVITPRRLIADIILRFVRARQNSDGSNVDALYRLEDNRAEAVQFNVLHDSKVCHTPLEELSLLKDLIVAFIIRHGDIIFPGGKDFILPGDRVVVVTTKNNLQDINDILT